MNENWTAALKLLINSLGTRIVLCASHDKWAEKVSSELRILCYLSILTREPVLFYYAVISLHFIFGQAKYLDKVIILNGIKQLQSLKFEAQSRQLFKMFFERPRRRKQRKF